jgi:hypothetical protein
MPTQITSAGITFNDTTSLTSATLVANSVGTTQITNGSVTASKLGTNEQKQICKAWVNFDGSLSTPITPRAQYNVSSVTKNGTGDYTVNFATAMADANYSVSLATITSSFNDFRPIVQGSTTTSSMTQSSVRVVNTNTTGASSSYQDCVMFSVQVFGN